jgi:hypothetical protein
MVFPEKGIDGGDTEEELRFVDSGRPCFMLTIRRWMETDGDPSAFIHSWVACSPWCLIVNEWVAWEWSDVRAHLGSSSDGRIPERTVVVVGEEPGTSCSLVKWAGYKQVSMHPIAHWCNEWEHV